jgi:uncharacterized protein YajQ (UPF0234 family)
MPSFDIVSELDKPEIKNAVEQANKEVANRFDFKGSDARIEQAELVLTLYADDDFKLDQVQEVLNAKLITATLKSGLETELSKKIVKQLKDSKMKVTASIQGESVRVSGAKRDVLQDAIALVRKSITDFPLQYQNFRD